MSAHIHSEPIVISTLSGQKIEIWSCLELLLVLTERLDFLERLPKADLEVIVPDPGVECPLCSSPYSRHNFLPDYWPKEINAVQLPCKHILCWICLHGILQVHYPGSIPCPFCRAEISTTPPDEYHFRPDIGLVSAPWTMMYHAVKTFLTIHPGVESMAQMIAWVHDVPRFQADVADVTLRDMIKAIVQEWEFKGPYVMWRLYFSSMGQGTDGESLWFLMDSEIGLEW